MGALALGTVLHFVMNHGIWHLIARIDLVGGSTGYHRFHLIDKAIAHFGERWLVGRSAQGQPGSRSRDTRVDSTGQ